jgi:hypothetical protein
VPATKAGPAFALPAAAFFRRKLPGRHFAASRRPEAAKIVGLHAAVHFRIKSDEIFPRMCYKSSSYSIFRQEVT